MSNEDNLHGLEDLDDTRQTAPVTAEQLKATPMSEPPTPVKRAKRKAKFNFRDLTTDTYQHIKVIDRYGNEQKDMLEFDPETFEGVRMLPNGLTQKCYLYNAYISADGYDHPDEDELPAIIENVKRNSTRKNVKMPQFVEEEYNAPPVNAYPPDESTIDIATHPKLLKCPKCQSALRMQEVINDKSGEIKHVVVCTNGNCGMKWHGVGQG